MRIEGISAYILKGTQRFNGKQLNHAEANKYLLCHSIDYSRTSTGEANFSRTSILYLPDGGVLKNEDVDNIPANWKGFYYYDICWTRGSYQYPTGSYQVDVFIDGIKVATTKFEIVK